MTVSAAVSHHYNSEVDASTRHGSKLRLRVGALGADGAMADTFLVSAGAAVSHLRATFDLDRDSARALVRLLTEALAVLPPELLVPLEDLTELDVTA